jgi:hypothetical protein
MTKRKETPDLLDQIQRQVTGKKPSKQQASKETPKVKNTYYFQQETSDRLDLLQVRLRQLTGEKLSKSEVIEAALLLALDDFDANRDQSDIATILLK